MKFFSTAILVALIGFTLSGCFQNGDKSAKGGQRVVRTVMYLDTAGKGRFLSSSGRVRDLLVQLHQAAVEGKIPAYKDDSFTVKYDTLEVRRRGGNSVTIDIPTPGNPDRVEALDTLIPFDPKSMRAFFVVERHAWNDLRREGGVKVQGFGLAFQPNIPGVRVYAPLFYLMEDDVKKVLKDEDFVWLERFSFESLRFPESQDVCDL